MATITRASDRTSEMMRRAAMGADQGPSAEQQGGYPYHAILRSLGDPQDPTNVSFPFLRRMRRDHMVSMGLHFIAMPIVKASWYYESTDARVAAFADNLIRPIYGRLVLTILRFLWAGYSPAVKNFETLQPGWVYYQDGEVKQVWDNGNIDAIVYKSIIPLRPESAMPKWDDAGNFNGIQYDTRYGDGAFFVNGQRKPDVDLLHSIWATHDEVSEDGSPWGFPRVAHCAPIFHMYRYIWTLLGRAFENSADPGPVMRFPQEDSILAAGTDGKPVNNSQTALRIGTKRRSGSTIALPSDTYQDYQGKPTGQKKWDIEFPKADTNFDALISFINYLESAKLRSLWIQEQGLVEGSGGTSNRNVASEFGQQRDASQIVLMQQIDELIDQTLVKPAIAMNFPTWQGTLTKKTIGLGADDEDTINQLIQLVGQQDYRNFGVDVRRLMDARGFPMLDPAEQKRQLEQAAQEAATKPTPVVEPTQGRRALVTQTGFNETAYHQLGGSIELSDDGDFVAGLPALEVFRDRSLLALSRRLRSRTAALTSSIFKDFAIYVGKQQRIVELAEALDERGAHELIEGWRIQALKLDEYEQATAATLQALSERTVKLCAQSLSEQPPAVTYSASEKAHEITSRVVSAIRSDLADHIQRTPTTSWEEMASAVRVLGDERAGEIASLVAREAAQEAYNDSLSAAGMALGVTKAQVIDPCPHSECRARHGEILDLHAASRQEPTTSRCDFSLRLLPGAEHFSVRREALDGAKARYDADTQTVLLSPSLERAEEQDFMLALGEALSRKSAAV